MITVQCQGKKGFGLKTCQLLLEFQQHQLFWHYKNCNNINKAEEGKMMPKRRNIRHNIQEELQSSIQNSTQHRYLENTQIQQLYEAYSRMKAFVEVRDQQSVGVIEDIIQKYCARTINFDLSPKNVMDILDKRIQRMLKNKKFKKNWSEEDTKILLWTFSRYAYRKSIYAVDDATHGDWINIAQLIPGSNADSCMFKVLSLKKVKLSEKKWTQIEEKILSKIVKQSSKKNWRVISQQLYKTNQQKFKIFRTAKQCKQHWVCYLNPDLKKGPWDLEQDKNLMQYVFVNNGVKRWAEIAKIFRGRTQNALKNRFTLMMERMRKDSPNVSREIELIQNFLKNIENNGGISRSGRRSGLEAKQQDSNNQQQAIVEEVEEVQEEQVPPPHNTFRNQNNQPQHPNHNHNIPHFSMMMANSHLHPHLNYYQLCIPANYVWVFKNSQQ